MTPEQSEGLRAAVYRNTGRDARWLGYWLQHHAEGEQLTLADIAQNLGISTEGFVLLCLCCTPRGDHFQEDVRVVCQRVGAKEDVLAGILRQEQALMRWREQEPGGTAGWLLAASDHEETQDSEQGGESDNDEH